MNMRAMTWVGIFVWVLLSVGAVAEAENKLSAQEKLEKEEAQIDISVVQSGGIIAKKLSDKFHLNPELIQEMRGEGLAVSPGGGQGWGEITILLSMARQLAKTHPKDYPTYDEALKRVRSLRSENATYEEMAQRLEFNLQPVLAEAQHIRGNLQSDKRSRIQDSPTKNQ